MIIRFVLGVLAVIGFVCSLAVHLAARRGVPVQDVTPLFWVLHLGIFVVFVPALIHLRRDSSLSGPLSLFRGFPPPVGLVLMALFIYALLNFFTAMSSLRTGTAGMRGDKFVFSKGRVATEITREQYQTARAVEARLFSGHWLLFYAIPAAAFLCRRSDDEA